MGFVVDDPSKPKDVGEAAKIFFNDGTNINCHGDWSPKCCPLFSINNHVIDWLSKPDRERYNNVCGEIMGMHTWEFFFPPPIDQCMSRNATTSRLCKTLLLGYIPVAIKLAMYVTMVYM